MNPFAWEKTERATRFTLFAGIGYVLSMASVSWIPSTLGFLVGILANILLALTPPLVYTAGALVPALTLAVFIALALLTAMLAAVTVSHFAVGFMFILYAVACLWMASLRFGKMGKLTSFVGLAVLYSLTLMLVYSFPYVKDGVQVDATYEQLQDLLQAEEQRVGSNTLLDVLVEGLENMLDEIKLVLQAIEDDDPSKLPISLEHSIDRGEFTGATVYVDFYSDKVTLGVEGGLWLVRGIWTWSGMDNPFAVVENFLITYFLAVAIYVASLLTPPWRTSRTFARDKLQKTTDICMRVLLRRAGTLVGGSGTSSPENGNENLSPAIMGFSNPSSIALLSSFEPYLLYPGPLVSTWLCLKDEVKAVHDLCAQLALTQTALCKSALKTNSEEGPEETTPDSDLFLRSHDLLRSCSALIREEPNLWHGTSWSRKEHELLQAARTDLAKVQAAVQDLSEGIGCCFNEDKVSMFPPRVLESLGVVSRQVCTVGTSSIRLAESQRKQSSTNILLNVFPLLLVPLAVLARLLSAACKAILVWKWLPSRWWNDPQVLWCLKYMAGLAALFSLSAFSAKFREWEVETNRDSSSFEEFLQNAPASKFGGWFTLGFITTFCLTLEGTIHKGCLRILGTCAGALSAWLALLCFPDSIYGLIAWMCITNFVTFSTTTHTENPLLGSHPSFGYAAQLFTYTQSIIVISVFKEIGSRDYITLNRLLANVSGIVVSVLVSHILPYRASRECPRIIRDVLLDASIALLRYAEQVEEAADEFACDLNFRSWPEVELLCKERLENAELLFEDASLFVEFPLYKIDPKLPSRMVSAQCVLAGLDQAAWSATLITKSNLVFQEKPSSQDLLEQRLHSLCCRKPKENQDDVSQAKEKLYAGRVTFSPGTRESLKDLISALREILQTESKPLSSSHGSSSLSEAQSLARAVRKPPLSPPKDGEGIAASNLSLIGVAIFVAKLGETLDILRTCIDQPCKPGPTSNAAQEANKVNGT